MGGVSVLEAGAPLRVRYARWRAIKLQVAASEVLRAG